MRKILALAAGAVLMSAPAVAQQQSGLVNVNVSDIEVELERIISDNNISAQIPVNAIVSVPVGIAANESVLSGPESVSLRFCVSNALARVKYAAGPDILDLHIKVNWSNGVIVLSPRVVQRRQIPSSFNEL
jgi:hypothetical protein